METSKEFTMDNKTTRLLIAQAFLIVLMVLAAASFFLPVRF